MKLILLIAILTAQPAFAQSRCAARSTVTDGLIQKFGEKVVAEAQAPNGDIVEIWSSATGSWTVTITKPNGVSCFAAAGTNFRIIKGDPV